MERGFDFAQRGCSRCVAAWRPILLQAAEAANYTVDAANWGFRRLVSASFAGMSITRVRRMLMNRAWVRACVLAACVVSFSVALSAQQVVHALTGTVSSIDKATHNIAVLQDVGGSNTFQGLANPKTRVDFDKKVQAGTIAADAFKDNGAYVIVFYFGTDENRTVLALKNLGAGPFASTVGTIKKFERGRSVSVQDQSGTVQTFKIGPETVGEADLGVQDGTRFQAQNGSKVRIVSSQVEGAAVALFIRTM